MPRVLLVLTIAAWMATAGSAAAAPGPPPLPGHIGFEAGAELAGHGGRAAEGDRRR